MGRAGQRDIPDAIGLRDNAWRDVLTELDHELHAGRLVVLVGSGVSQFAPSSVPYAHQIRQALHRKLTNALPASVRERFAEATAMMPFEILMGRLNELRQDLARDVASALTRVSAPNAMHCQIAHLLARAAEADVPLRVVTTNYDTGITLGWRELRRARPVLPEPRVIVRPDDIVPSGGGLDILHVHGATTDPASLVLDHQDEFRLSPWKLRYLASVLPGSTLLVLGFSGWDLDVSSAISRHRLRGVVWLRRTREECDPSAWSFDARAILNTTRRSAGLCVQADVDNDLCHALAGLVPVEAACATVDAGAVALRFAEVWDLCERSNREPWLRLWSRWTALRANFAEMGASVTVEEAAVLPASMLSEIRSFGHFYAGRYRTGAEWQAAAARQSRAGNEPADRYLYFRNNEIEFWNRGAFTGQALMALIGTLTWVVWHRVRGDALSAAGRAELRNVIGSLFFMWPLPALYLVALPFQPAIARILAAATNITLGADFDKHAAMSAVSGSPTSALYESVLERYRWLGQQARLINLYRIGGLQLLRRYRRGGRIADLAAARQLVGDSARWADSIDDEFRRAKSWLVALELESELVADSVRFVRHAEARAAVAWDMVDRAEVNKLCRCVARLVHAAGRRGGWRRGRRWLRTLGLYLLETS